MCVCVWVFVCTWASQLSEVFSSSLTVIRLSAICPSLKHQLFSKRPLGKNKKQLGDYAPSFILTKMFCSSLSCFSSRRSLLWGFSVSAFWRFYLSMFFFSLTHFHLSLKMIMFCLFLNNEYIFSVCLYAPHLCVFLFDFPWVNLEGSDWFPEDTF